jgi:hypothetical protein
MSGNASSCANNTAPRRPQPPSRPRSAATSPKTVSPRPTTSTYSPTSTVPDDPHHAAAAAAGKATTLITWNLTDFPATTLGPLGITATDPDTYLCSLLERDPIEVTATLRRMAAEKRRPPITTGDLIDALARARVPVFARRARSLLAAV